MDELSARRKQILSFIRSFISKKGYAPSVREIASGCGLSCSACWLFWRTASIYANDYAGEQAEQVWVLSWVLSC